MKDYKKELALFLFILFFAFSESIAQNKKIQNCTSEVKGGEYKLVSGTYSLKEPKNLLLFIVVKPEKIKREFMVVLAKRIKSEFCNDDDLQVVIFDDVKYANTFSLSDYVNSDGKIILMRGFYTFNRKTGTDVLEFSTKRGNPTTEIQINFALENNIVSE